MDKSDYVEIVSYLYFRCINCLKFDYFGPIDHNMIVSNGFCKIWSFGENYGKVCHNIVCYKYTYTKV